MEYSMELAGADIHTQVPKVLFYSSCHPHEIHEEF
jgi:hypothetical protein